MADEAYVTAEQARLIARAEISSMAGLVLRRAQEVQLTRNPETNITTAAVHEELSEIFGEILRDFSATTAEPGA